MRSLFMLSLGLLVAFAAGCSASTDDTPAAAANEADVTGDKILLDCNVFEGGGGPDQQATVVQRGDALVLKELTNHGAMVERPLDKAEWDKRDLKLRLDTYDGPDTKNRLYKADGEWLNTSVGGGWSTYGSAYCFKDTTKGE